MVQVIEGTIIQKLSEGKTKITSSYWEVQVIEDRG